MAVPKQKAPVEKALNSLKEKFKDCEGVLASEFIEHPGLSIGGQTSTFNKFCQDLFKIP